MFPSLSSLFTSRYIVTFIAISSLYISLVHDQKPLFRPKDILPVLQISLSRPILNSLYDDAVDVLPIFVGSVSPDDKLEWNGTNRSCFNKNTAWLELHNKSRTEFGGGTLHIKVSNSHSRFCMDLYVFTSPFQMTWDYYFREREHTKELVWQGKAEFEYVQNKGVAIFLMPEGAVGTFISLRHVLPLFTNTGWGEKANIAFLKKHMGASFVERPQPWVTNVSVDDIHSGDLLLLSGLRGPWGGFQTLEKWVTGAYAGHVAVFLKDSEGKLWVAESGRANDEGNSVIAIVQWEEWWNFELTKDTDSHIAFLPLHPDVRAKFDKVAAWKFARSMEGKPYGFHNILFGWIDTIKDNYPPPAVANVIATFMTIWTRIKPDYAANMWNEGLNIRLGTQGLNLSEIMAEVVRRGSSFDELLAMPEQDIWIYSDGKSTNCVSFVIQVLKAAGLFNPITSSIQATEFTVNDAYTLKFFENNLNRLPKWCNDGDNVKLPFCQIKGKYRMELPRYNTMDPYSHMNEKCPSLPPKYDRPQGC